MLNVEIESTKVNILSSQLLIFPCVSTDYMLVFYKFWEPNLVLLIRLRISNINILIHIFLKNLL